MENNEKQARKHWYEIDPARLEVEYKVIEMLIPESKAEFGPGPDGAMYLPIRKTVFGRDWVILVRYAEDRPEARVALMPYMVSPTPDEAIRLLNEAGRHVQYLPCTIRDAQENVILSVVTPESIRNRLDGMEQLADCYKGVMAWITCFEQSLVDDAAWARLSGRSVEDSRNSS